MPDPTHKPAENLHHPLRNLSTKQAEFLALYLNRQSPAYLNATKAAEWAGYKGAPGSVQLSVQGHRTLKNPAVQKCLAEVLAEAGCTLERDAQVLAEAMGATQTKYLLGKNGQLIETPAQPNHAMRLRAVEQKNHMLGASRPKIAQVAGGDLSPEFAEAIQEVAKLILPFRDSGQIDLPDLSPAQQKLQKTAQAMTPAGRLLVGDAITSVRRLLNLQSRSANTEPEKDQNPSSPESPETAS